MICMEGRGHGFTAMHIAIPSRRQHVYVLLGRPRSTFRRLPYSPGVLPPCRQNTKSTRSWLLFPIQQACSGLVAGETHMISHRSSSSSLGDVSPGPCSSQKMSIPTGVVRLFSHAFIESRTKTSSCTCKENCFSWGAVGDRVTSTGQFGKERDTAGVTGQELVRENGNRTTCFPARRQLLAALIAVAEFSYKGHC